MTTTASGNHNGVENLTRKRDADDDDHSTEGEWSCSVQILWSKSSSDAITDQGLTELSWRYHDRSFCRYQIFSDRHSSPIWQLQVFSCLLLYTNPQPWCLTFHPCMLLPTLYHNSQPCALFILTRITPTCFRRWTDSLWCMGVKFSSWSHWFSLDDPLQSNAVFTKSMGWLKGYLILKADEIISCNE